MGNRKERMSPKTFLIIYNEWGFTMFEDICWLSGLEWFTFFNFEKALVQMATLHSMNPDQVCLQEQD